MLFKVRRGYDRFVGGWGSESVLWSLADPESRGQVDVATAVAAALAEMEKSAAWTRRRRGGRLVREETEGLLAVVVPHTSSRDGDPQLHHHVVEFPPVAGHFHKERV